MYICLCSMDHVGPHAPTIDDKWICWSVGPTTPAEHFQPMKSYRYRKKLLADSRGSVTETVAMLVDLVRRTRDKLLSTELSNFRAFTLTHTTSNTFNLVAHPTCFGRPSLYHSCSRSLSKSFYHIRTVSHCFLSNSSDIPFFAKTWFRRVQSHTWILQSFQFSGCQTAVGVKANSHPYIFLDVVLSSQAVYSISIGAGVDVSERPPQSYPTAPAIIKAK
jgi:hypothetical protein